MSVCGQEGMTMRISTLHMQQSHGIAFGWVFLAAQIMGHL